MENRTFFMNVEKNKIQGFIDQNLDAVKQASFLILQTPRYEHLIYSSDYGNELLIANGLLGKEQEYVQLQAKRMISEALLVDERIQDVRNFHFTFNQDCLNIHFEIISIYGNFESEVKLNGVL